MGDGNNFFGGYLGSSGEKFAEAGPGHIVQAGPIPIVWPEKLNPRVDFKPTELNKLILNRGLPALWQLWVPCACGHEQAGDVNCPQCGGTGRYYHSTQEVLVAVTSQRRDWERFEKMGQWEAGTASFLIRGEHVPCFGDRIIMLNNHIPIASASIRRSPVAGYEAPAIEKLRYPVVPQSIPIRLEDGSVENRLYGVLFLQGQKSDGTLGPALIEGTDFDVTEEGDIDWTKGDALGTTPAPGKMFSISYRTRPVYQVTDFPTAWRDTMTQYKSETVNCDVLPVEFTGRLEWLIEAT